MEPDVGGIGPDNGDTVSGRSCNYGSPMVKLSESQMHETRKRSYG